MVFSIAETKVHNLVRMSPSAFVMLFTASGNAYFS